MKIIVVKIEKTLPCTDEKILTTEVKPQKLNHRRSGTFGICHRRFCDLKALAQPACFATIFSKLA